MGSGSISSLNFWIAYDCVFLETLQLAQSQYAYIASYMTSKVKSSYMELSYAHKQIKNYAIVNPNTFINIATIQQKIDLHALWM